MNWYNGMLIVSICLLVYTQGDLCIGYSLCDFVIISPQISSQFFDFSWQLWQRDAQAILHGFSVLAQSLSSNALETHDDLYITCQRWYLCSKILRQLIIAGFQSDARSMQVSVH